MSETPAEQAERREKLAQLLQALRADGLVADLVTPDLMTVSGPRTPGIEVPVRCGPRVSRGGVLWFFGRDSRPLAPADQIEATVTELRKQAAVHL